jgi:putative FmdB family regulatory protein
MPSYDFYCETCQKEVTLVLTIAERDRGGYACPTCGGKRLQPLMSAFFSKTSRKS